MGGTMNYKIGHYYKRMYHDNCWIVFRVNSVVRRGIYMEVQTLRAKGFMKTPSPICLLHNTDKGGWTTKEIEERDIVWEVL